MAERYDVRGLRMSSLRASNEWNLRVDGFVASPRTLSYEEVDRLPKVRMTEDFHCLTGRVTPNIEWEGVAVSDILRSVEMSEGAKYVLFGCGDYTTVLDMELAMRDNTIIALRRAGKAMTEETGGPFRLVFGGNRGYDSVKSVDRIELLDKDIEGTARCASTIPRGDAQA